MNNKILITLLSLLFISIIGFYGYYNYLSYNIYRDIDMYIDQDNELAIDISKRIIIEKYPYSIPYFKIK